MQEFVGPVDAVNALQDFIIDRVAPLPDDVREQLRLFLRERSPVVTAVNTAELIYARRDEIPEEMKDIAAAAAVMGEAHGFHGLGVDNRGSRMASVLRDQPIEGEPPEPQDRYIPQLPVDEAPPAPVEG